MSSDGLTANLRAEIDEANDRARGWLPDISETLAGIVNLASALREHAEDIEASDARWLREIEVTLSGILADCGGIEWDEDWEYDSMRDGQAFAESEWREGVQE